MYKRVCEMVLAIVLIVLGLLNLSPNVHKWVLVIGGLVLLIHAFMCKRCCSGQCKNEMPEKAKVRRRK